DELKSLKKVPRAWSRPGLEGLLVSVIQMTIEIGGDGLIIWNGTGLHQSLDKANHRTGATIQHASVIQKQLHPDVITAIDQTNGADRPPGLRFVPQCVLANRDRIELILPILHYAQP